MVEEWMTSPAHGSDSDGWSHHGIEFHQGRDANQHGTQNLHRWFPLRKSTTIVIESLILVQESLCQNSKIVSGCFKKVACLFFQVKLPCFSGLLFQLPAFPRILRRRCAVGVGLKADARHWESVVSCESKDIPLVMSMIMISLIDVVIIII